MNFQRLLFNVFFFLFVFNTVKSTGYLELHLQSPYVQSVSVNISSDSKTEKVIIVPEITLEPKGIYNVTRIPIIFDERIYNVTIKCGESKEEGLLETTTVVSFSPRFGLLSPAAVARPLNGIRLIIRCDPNFYGEKCDVLCRKAERKVCNSEGKLSCSNGKTGIRCEKKLSQSDCKCENSGKCVDFGGFPNCHCPREFRGEKCELKQRSASLSSHYKGDFWNFRMTFWQMIFSNLVENQLAEVKHSDAWETIQKILGNSNETPFSKRPNDTVGFPMTGSVDLSSIDQ